MKKSNLSPRRINIPYFLGIGIILLIALIISLTVQQTQKRTSTRSNASASTTLSFSQATPQVNTGDTLSMDVMMNPGTNAISFVKLVISYDNSQVQPTVTGLVPNNTAFPQILDGPTYNTCSGTSCTMSVQSSIGSNPTNAIITPTKVATVNFKIIGSNAQTQISFASQTQILSLAASDSPNENVLSTTTPSNISIGNISNFTPSPTSALTTQIPTPTINLNATPTTVSNFTPTPTSTTAATPTSTSGSNDLVFDLKLIFPGIGINGGTQHPLHAARKVHIVFYDFTGQIYTIDTVVIFDGKYFVQPSFDAGQIPPGDYQIFVRSPMYLTTRLLQQDGTSTFTILSNPTTPFSLPINAITAGDVASADLKTYGDDVLDLLDYNTIIGCYKKKMSTSACTNKISADIDDNGIVDGVDYNIWLRSISITNAGDNAPIFPAIHTANTAKK